VHRHQFAEKGIVRRAPRAAFRHRDFRIGSNSVGYVKHFPATGDDERCDAIKKIGGGILAEFASTYFRVSEEDRGMADMELKWRKWCV
jgi:hypothetical protein